MVQMASQGFPHAFQQLRRVAERRFYLLSDTEHNMKMTILACAA